MRKLLVAALAAVLFPVFAMADEVPLIGKDQGYQAIYGNRSNLSSGAGNTNDVVDFGFWSSAVRFCVNASASQGPVYWRRGSTLSDSPGAARASQDPAGMTVVATTDAIFQSGNPTASAGIASGQAALIQVFSTSATTPGSLDDMCVTYPVRTRGVIVHASGGNTVDVTAFGNPN